ncbi:hypothetical protein JTB14_013105 [Gonioctena quinquepunctata]|nr:hypothetical protein JTB14_013105 [Gonioctena quinquepunctata]
MISPGAYSTIFIKLVVVQVLQTSLYIDPILPHINDESDNKKVDSFSSLLAATTQYKKYMTRSMAIFSICTSKLTSETPELKCVDITKVSKTCMTVWYCSDCRVEGSSKRMNDKPSCSRAVDFRGDLIPERKGTCFIMSITLSFIPRETRDLEVEPQLLPFEDIPGPSSGLLAVPLEVLSPVPRGRFRSGQGKRKPKTRKSHAILTSTPNMQEINNKAAPKNLPDKRKREVTRILFDSESDEKPFEAQTQHENDDCVNLLQRSVFALKTRRTLATLNEF